MDSQNPLKPRCYQHIRWRTTEMAKGDKKTTKKLACETVRPGDTISRRSFIRLGGGALAAAVCPRGGGWSNATNSDRLILPEDSEVRTGGSRMIEIDGGHQVWTKKVGNAPIKVLLLHGGPGLDHTYFECFEDFFPPNGIEFYYYDQLDSTNSDKPGDPRLWTVERFCHEVETVRKGLGLEQFYLLGHSWGGMLAIEYALLTLKI